MIQKIVFRTVVVLLIIFVILPWLPLEFTNRKHEDTFIQLRFLAIPTCILLTLTGTLNSRYSGEHKGTTIVLTILAAISSVFFLVIGLFLGMCMEYTENTLYLHKESNSLTIVRRSYGCGATDSSPASFSTYKAQEITPYLIWFTKVDTAAIDKSEWIRVQEN